MMKMAFRNLWRRKMRTTITATSIAFGFFLAVIVVGVRESSSERLIAVGTKSGFGYISIGDASFEANHAQRSELRHTESLWKGINGLPEIRAALPRRVGEALLQSATRNTGAGWIAVDPKRETKDVNLYCSYMVEGSCGPEWTHGAIIGAVLSEKLRLKVQDQLIYTIQFADGQNISLLTEIHGIFQTGSDDRDAHLFLIPLDELNEQLPEDSRTISFIALFVEHSSRVSAIIKRLLPIAQDEKILSWHETMPSLVEFFAADRMMYYSLLTFIGIVIAAGITTCMNVSFVERRREIGTMLAIGMLPKEILKLLLEEALILGIIGLALGMVTVAPFYAYLHYIGLDVSPVMGHKVSVGGVTQANMIIHCELLVSQFVVITLTPLLSSVVASIVPAYMSAYTLPVEILRED